LKTIEINTTQNVKIEYRLASVSDRIIAFVIDFVLMGIGFLFISYFSLVFFNNNANTTIQIVVFFWIGFYTLASELIGYGQSLGKKAMGIKIIKLNGDELDFYDYFNRWVMRLLEIYFTMGTLAIIFIIGSKNGQRLGDILAGTAVVKKQDTFGFRLSDILKLNQKKMEDIEFKYPLVNKLSESDVILIKNILYRSQKFSNSAHQATLNSLTQKVMEILEINEINDPQNVFLNRVISEYIIKTR
jgi:uncharacterized RDD family membrane protein YckC